MKDIIKFAALTAFLWTMVIIVWFVMMSHALASETVRNGNYSDSKTWDTPPTEGVDALIKHEVNLDSGCGGNAKCKVLTVSPEGKLTFVGGTLETWGSLINYGQLEGKEGTIKFHVADDRLFTGNGPSGPDPTMPDFHPDDIGLWNFGKCNLGGIEVTRRVRVLPQIVEPKPYLYGTEMLAGITDGAAKLDKAPIGWKIGDTLVLTGLDGTYKLSKLTAIQGDLVNFDDTTFESPVVRHGEEYAYPVITNLSGRFVFESADVTVEEPWHRAHTMSMHSNSDVKPCAQFNYVEFRNLGPRGKLGRYPTHYHLMGSSPCCAVNYCSMWQSIGDPGSRFISVHGTSDVAVIGNVGFLSQGHGFFSENGREAGNTWQGNTSIGVFNSEEITPIADSVTRNGTLKSGSSVGSTSSHYWMRTGSTIKDNLAIGGTAEFGMMLHPTKITDAPATTPIESLEGYGVSGWLLWTNYNNAEFVNPISIKSKIAATSTSFIYPGVSGLKLTNPKFWFDGIVPSSKDAPYTGAIFLNQQPKCEIIGGSLLTNIAINMHYRSGLTLTGTKINTDILMDPTYWQGKTEWLIDGADITAGRLFKSAYPIELPLTTLRIQNSMGQVGGKSVNGRFTHSLNTAFQGVPEMYQAIRINE